MSITINRVIKIIIKNVSSWVCCKILNDMLKRSSEVGNDKKAKGLI